MTWMVFWLVGCAGDVVQGSVSEGPGVVPVETWTLAPRVIPRTGTWTGVLRGEHQATVLSETGGRVTAVVAEVGQPAASGATIVRLEEGRQRLGVRAAEATQARAGAGAEAAERQLSRLEAIGDAVSRADLEDAATALELARADQQAAQVQLDARQRDLEDTRVRSPFAGEVTRLHVALGEVIAAGTPVATVVDSQTLRVRIGVSTSDLDGVVPGMAATVQDRPCSVVSLDRQVDPATGLVQVEVACGAEPDWIIGAPVRVGLDLGDPGPSLAVPTTAVLERYGETLVYVVVGGVATARTVQPGLRNDTWLEVLDGLAVGDVVVVRGAERLVEGSPVLAR